jgi:Na+/H+-dicarboxylate symporter
MLKRPSLPFYIFLSIILGILAGWLIGPPIQVISKPLADIFMRLLRMVIVPLIFAAVISGVLGIGETKNLGRMGAKLLGYYLTTSLLAILVGLTLMNLVRPGVGTSIALEGVPQIGDANFSKIGEVLLNIIPENPLKAMVEGNMLAVIFFCILLAVFIIRLPQKGRLLFTDIFSNLFEVMMMITGWIISLAPFGIFGLISNVVATTGFSAFGALFKFFLVVLTGLMIHLLITLPLLLRILGKVPHPYRHLKAMTEALLTAFSTASSNATLPVTMKCVETKSGVSKELTSFILPLGAAGNMDGTALYECSVAVFIAQVYGVELGFFQQLLILLIALVTSLGVTGIPMASLVAIAIILKAVGLPLEGIGLIMVTDRILDMCRTTVNVFSDSCGAVIVARSEGEKTKLL